VANYFSHLEKLLGKTGSGKSSDPKAAWKIPDPSESLGSGSTNTVDIFRTRRRVRCAMWRILSSAYLEKPLGKTGARSANNVYFFRTRKRVLWDMWRVLLLRKLLEKSGFGKHDSESCLENFGSVRKSPDPKTLFIFSGREKSVHHYVANSFPYLKKSYKKPDPESMIPFRSCI
jgi:hypothetical protein